MSVKRSSIQSVLQRRLLLLLVSLGLLTLIPTHFGIRYLVEDVVSTRLEQDAETLVAVLTYQPDKGWSLPEESLSLVYQRVQSGHYYRIIGEAFSQDSRSLWDSQPDVAPMTSGQHDIQVLSNQQGELLLTYSFGFVKQEQPFTLWLAEDVTSLLNYQLTLEAIIALIIAAFIFITVSVQRRMIQQAFAPLEPIRKVILEGDLATNIELPPDVPEEISPLVSAIRKLIERSSSQIVRSRTSLGNLAHELKRPIQRLQWLAEDATDAESKDTLLGIADSFKNLTDRELRRARISGSPSPGRLFNPQRDLSDLLAFFERTDAKGITLKAQLPDKPLPYDRDDMLELSGNLLDNAYRYGASQIRIAWIDQGDHWLFSIEDDGPGVPETELDQFALRGVRLDENETVSGSGLGIAISKAVVESYSGNIEFGRSSRGGLSVICKLPVTKLTEFYAD